MRVFLSSCGSFFHLSFIAPLESCLFTSGKFFNIISSIMFSLGFPGSSAGKESACIAEDLGSIPWRRERLTTPVFWLENPMDRGRFHGVAKSRTGLSDFHFHFPFSLFYSEYHLDRFFQVEKRQRKKMR